ncbi:TIGR04104 family putative zinc finger protein [Oceanobacillus sp. CFH 90083]|uniref:TIGR04104 family putative zinc finger protein n=1 Tax=Oceanobacillus sp. CFH 90083 TaxID=2592336 RepID=UPI0018844D59|nr:TIGR04104 family putative zinc finger protein [Oceanobacillus sp. CFH 90083]
MATCQHCHNKWTWKQTMKTTTTLNTAYTCPYCGKKQYATKKSRTQFYFLTLIPLIALLLNLFHNIPVWFIFSWLILGGAVVLSLFPAVLKLTNKEEFFF